MIFEQIKDMEPEYYGEAMSLLKMAFKSGADYDISNADTKHEFSKGTYISFKSIRGRTFPIFFIGTHLMTNRFVLEVIA